MPGILWSQSTGVVDRLDVVVKNNRTKNNSHCRRSKVLRELSPQWCHIPTSKGLALQLSPLEALQLIHAS